MRHLIVDGYNAIHGWAELRAVLARDGLDEARRQLLAALVEYGALGDVSITVVFDSSAASPSRELVDGVRVCFASHAASADHVIERLVYETATARARERITVATSDRLQRDVVAAMGAATISVEFLEREVREVRQAARVDGQRRSGGSQFHRRLEHRLDAKTRQRLERLRRGDPDA